MLLVSRVTICQVGGCLGAATATSHVGGWVFFSGSKWGRGRGQMQCNCLTRRPVPIVRHSALRRARDKPIKNTRQRQPLSYSAECVRVSVSVLWPISHPFGRGCSVVCITMPYMWMAGQHSACCRLERWFQLPKD